MTEEDRLVQDSAQSVVKRMIYAAMREFCRAPERYDFDRVWNQQQQTLQWEFSQGYQVESFSIEAQDDGSQPRCIRLKLARELLRERETREVCWVLPVFSNWQVREEHAQAEGLLP